MDSNEKVLLSTMVVKSMAQSPVKIQGSAFKCHVDGPVDDPPFPVPKISDLLKSVEIPEEMNFIIAPDVSTEVADFLAVVDMYVLYS